MGKGGIPLRHSAAGMLTRRLSVIALALAFSPLLLNKPDEGGGGGGNPPTLESQLTSARTDLTAAQSQVSTITSERDTARAQLLSITTERDQLRGQFDALTTSANQLRTDLTAAQSQVGTLTSERDTARNSEALATANVTRLETLCNIRGVDSKQAVKVGETSAPAQSTATEWNTKLAAATTPEARNAVLKEFTAACKAGSVARA